VGGVGFVYWKEYRHCLHHHDSRGEPTKYQSMKRIVSNYAHHIGGIQYRFIDLKLGENTAASQRGEPGNLHC
jgi:hypothetical protein